MKKAEYQLETLTCPSCVKKIETILGGMDGVQTVKVLFHSSKVKVQYEEAQIQAERMKEALEKLGYLLLSTKTLGS
ncbi:heavy-metal-associated domain-containing protein [Gorillibacterium sp. CAU 1737]|uniref:heavy-metal-associated domain-containing protein n=1 Tax=Gorillibacterium sp. CAU 1737 TaxID=3140362 RepID=UPI0032614EB9